MIGKIGLKHREFGSLFTQIHDIFDFFSEFDTSKWLLNKIIRQKWRMIYNVGMKVSSQIKESSQEFKIFANEQRLAILVFLKSEGNKSVGQIADGLEISFKNTSKHLLYLAKRGILERHYDGAFVLYKISNNLPKFTQLIIYHL
jgi:DNA-binding transcriptional ArsR family regulator